MKIEKAGLEETGNFAKIFLDYVKQDPRLKDFYNLPANPKSFSRQIESKAFSDKNRSVLHRVLREQYSELEKTAAVEQNLQSLVSPNTFTLVTGHQLNIFTGPLYFIFKIITTIRMCEVLKELHPGHNFVPVYWMASEDHDFEEINHFHLFNKTYTWNSTQTGGVGSFDPTGIKEILDELPEPVPLFEQAYLGNDTLADATRYLVNGLFGDQGLLVIDSNHAALKGLFKTIIKDDVLNHRANDMVESTSSRLADLGYETQVHPRSVNFFYLAEGVRERIYREDGKYKVKNTDLTFTEKEILDLIEHNPEHFSPNVIMRPLYQEVILPNLGYVGGPAEIAYWLQLKKIFDHYQIPLPILIPRNFGMVINRSTNKKIEKLELQYQDIFLSIKEIQEIYSHKNSDNPIDLSKQKEHLRTLFESIKQITQNIDRTLVGVVGAEQNKAEKSLDYLESRIKKSEERKHGVAFGQIESVKTKLFPDGNLQERHDNFLNFYLNNPGFLKEVKTALDPFDFRFHLLIDD